MGYTDVTERELEFYWNSNVRKGTSEDYEDDEVNVNDWGGWGINGESKQNMVLKNENILSCNTLKWNYLKEYTSSCKSIQLVLIDKLNS